MIDVLAIGRVNVACRALGNIDRTTECALAEPAVVSDPAKLGDHSHAQLCIGEMRCRQLVVEAAVRRAATAVDGDAPFASELATAAKVIASEEAVRAVESASRLAASRCYVGTSELAHLRHDAPTDADRRRSERRASTRLGQVHDQAARSGDDVARAYGAVADGSVMGMAALTEPRRAAADDAARPPGGVCGLDAAA